jgi:xanthine/uracil permease
LSCRFFELCGRKIGQLGTVQKLLNMSLGLLSLLLRWITPLTIGPAVAMIGLSLFDVAASNASQHWGVAAG